MPSVGSWPTAPGPAAASFNTMAATPNGTTSIWIAPETNFAVVACTNYGGTGAFNAVDAVVGRLIQDFALP